MEKRNMVKTSPTLDRQLILIHTSRNALRKISWVHQIVAFQWFQCEAFKIWLTHAIFRKAEDLEILSAKLNCLHWRHRGSTHAKYIVDISFVYLCARTWMCLCMKRSSTTCRSFFGKPAWWMAKEYGITSCHYPKIQSSSNSGLVTAVFSNHKNSTTSRRSTNKSNNKQRWIMTKQHLHLKNNDKTTLQSARSLFKSARTCTVYTWITLTTDLCPNG